MANAAIVELTTLGQSELEACLRARLGGAAAGLPLGLDEPPEDLILSAYDEAGNDEFRARVRTALAKLLREHVGGRLQAAILETPEAPASDAVLERLLLVVGLTGAREALPAVKAYLPAFSDGSSSLGLRLFNAVASLAGPEDAALVPWLQDYARDAQLCRLALSALWYVHRPSAMSVLPQVAQTLGRGDGALTLARTLASLLGGLSGDELSAFLYDLEPALAGAPGSVEALAEALEHVPGLHATHRRHIRAWPRMNTAAPEARSEFHVKVRSALDRTSGGAADEDIRHRVWNLRLARNELLRQRTATTHSVRREQIAHALADIDRQLAELASLRPVAPSLPPKTERAPMGTRPKLQR